MEKTNCAGKCSAESPSVEEAKKNETIQLKLECLKLAKGLAASSDFNPIRQTSEDLITAAKELFNFINQ